MKVLDVCEFYSESGGGVRTYVQRKLAAASSLGVEVVIVAPGSEDRVQRCAGGRIVWVKSPVMPLDARYHLLCDERAVHARIAAEQPDVLEGSSPWAGGWMTARYPGETPRSFIFHQDPVAVYPHSLCDWAMSRRTIDRACEPYWAYLRRLASRFDATVVAGEWLAERLRGHGIQGVCTVPFGIDKDVFHPARGSRAVRESWLQKAVAPRDAYLLVAVSRHHPEKRLGTLLAAVDRLHAGRELERPVALVLFGDGPLRGWIERRARHVPYVHVAGFTKNVDELAQVLASADAFLHGSAAETYGLVVAEALCSGLPLVVPDVGGARDLACEGYAEVYRAGDARSCAQATARLLQRARQSLDMEARRARTEVVLSAEQHFARLFDLYADLSRTATRGAA